MPKPNRHEEALRTERDAKLTHAAHVLKELERLSVAVKRSLDAGGFPVYLDELSECTRALEGLASAFNALSRVQIRASCKTRKPSRGKKRKV